MWVGRGDAETEIRISLGREKKRLAREAEAGRFGGRAPRPHPLNPAAARRRRTRRKELKPTTHGPYSVTSDSQAQAVADQFIKASEEAEQALGDQ